MFLSTLQIIKNYRKDDLKMSNINYFHRIDLLYLFVSHIAVTPRIWFGDQHLVLNRAFPDILFEMFKVWYERFYREKTDEDISKLFPDLETFARALSEALKRHRIKHELKVSRSKYSITRYPYKYSFSIRLSKLGIGIYSQVLPGRDAIADTTDVRNVRNIKPCSKA